MQNSVVETIIGAIVVAVAVMFLIFVYQTSGKGQVGGYEVLAKFNRVDGVTVGTDVRVSGIKVGTVSAMDIDPKTYMAVLHISIRGDVKLPTDSSARITSEGLLGNNYLSIEPGADDNMIAAGGEIENTQGSIDLIGLLSKAMFSGGSEGGTPNAPAPAAASPAPAGATP
jgi:phospholipid/cholesterol/gamma-HCH transport system substrate-binding protein